MSQELYGITDEELELIMADENLPGENIEEEDLVF